MDGCKTTPRMLLCTLHRSLFNKVLFTSHDIYRTKTWSHQEALYVLLQTNPDKTDQFLEDREYSSTCIMIQLQSIRQITCYNPVKNHETLLRAIKVLLEVDSHSVFKTKLDEKPYQFLEFSVKLENNTVQKKDRHSRSQTPIRQSNFSNS